MKTIFIKEFEAPDEVTMLEIQKFLQYVTSKNEVIQSLICRIFSTKKVADIFCIYLHSLWLFIVDKAGEEQELF